jgi:hypothetical protein
MAEKFGNPFTRVYWSPSTQRKTNGLHLRFLLKQILYLVTPKYEEALHAAVLRTEEKQRLFL